MAKRKRLSAIGLATAAALALSACGGAAGAVSEVAIGDYSATDSPVGAGITAGDELDANEYPVIIVESAAPTREDKLAALEVGMSLPEVMDIFGAEFANALVTYSGRALRSLSSPNGMLSAHITSGRVSQIASWNWRSSQAPEPEIPATGLGVTAAAANLLQLGMDIQDVRDIIGLEPSFTTSPWLSTSNWLVFSDQTRSIAVQFRTVGDDTIAAVETTGIDFTELPAVDVEFIANTTDNVYPHQILDSNLMALRLGMELEQLLRVLGNAAVYDNPSGPLRNSERLILTTVSSDREIDDISLVFIAAEVADYADEIADDSYADDPYAIADYPDGDALDDELFENADDIQEPNHLSHSPTAWELAEISQSGNGNFFDNQVQALSVAELRGNEFPHTIERREELVAGLDDIADQEIVIQIPWNGDGNQLNAIAGFGQQTRSFQWFRDGVRIAGPLPFGTLPFRNTDNEGRDISSAVTTYVQNLDVTEHVLSPVFSGSLPGADPSRIDARLVGSWHLPGIMPRNPQRRLQQSDPTLRLNANGTFVGHVSTGFPSAINGAPVESFNSWDGTWSVQNGVVQLNVLNTDPLPSISTRQPTESELANRRCVVFLDRIRPVAYERGWAPGWGRPQLEDYFDQLATFRGQSQAPGDGTRGVPDCQFGFIEFPAPVITDDFFGQIHENGQELGWHRSN